MMQVTKVWWDGEKLMAEPIDPASVYKEEGPCNNALRALGKAYPRTCSKCGFGPCSELGRVQAAPEENVEWGVDWGRAGDIPCVSIIKRLPGGRIEVVAVEYAPYTFKEKNT